MVARRRGTLSLAMIAIMLLAVQIPLANELGRVENGVPTYTSTSCSSAIRPTDSAIHVDILNGSDTWNGTTNCPKATIGGAVQGASPNDEIVVHSGVYHENITIDNLDGLTIRAAAGERVVIDGTKSISEDFNATWHTASDGIQYVDLPEHGWQLFLDYSEQVPARWPNANFENGTVFNRSHNWAHGTITNSNNAYTNGWLTDAGAVTGAHGGLLASGIDPVGAIAILNVASFRSYSREITSWNSSNETIGFDPTDLWKTKHHAYFLEGKRDLIDVDGEWWYNDTVQRLHYMTPTNQDANDLDLRVKTQPFAFSVTNSDEVSLEDLEFFATTARFDDCDGCSIKDTTMHYPSTSKRGLNIAGEDVDDRWVTRFDHCTQSLVDGTAILYTDGSAIEFHGGALQSHNNTINNSYFHHIDWSVSDTPGLMVTIIDSGKDNTFSNSTIHLTGASATISIGDAPTVIHNEVWNTGLLQTDGAIVQMMMAEQQDANIAYNWIHDSDKYGIRMDGPAGGTNQGRNATVHHNVLWNMSGAIMVKGDYHNAHNNTVFGDDRGKNQMIVLHESDAGNENSSIWNNAADSIAAHRSQGWDDHPLQIGTFGLNWNGYLNGSSQSNVSSMLVDPDNRDFRPLPYSDLDNLDAGAYDALDANPWVPGITWTYTRTSNPYVGCLDVTAENYDQHAVFSSGECEYQVIVIGDIELDIEAIVNTDENHVKVDVDFRNVTAEDGFEYEIWFTRVDPDYKHENFTGSIEPADDGTTYRTERFWTPPQDGPYTVHCTVTPTTSDEDWILANGTDTFDWGDVANHSHPPVVNISASYAEDAEQKVGIHRGQEKTYFDIYNNETRQESIVISFDAYDMENDGDYSLTFRLYQIEDEGANYLLGMTLSTFHASYNLVSLNASPGWIEGAEYKFTLGLYLDWGNVTESGFATYYFTEGSPPVLTSPGCTDLNATNYDANATVDDGSCEYKDTDNDGVFDHLEIEGCTDRNATNFDANATEDDKTCEFEDTDQDGVFDHLEITGCMDINATNFDSNATDDDGTCNYLDTDGDGIFDHLEIEGCLDSDAANYNPDATDSGACTYPEFSVDIVTDQTTGVAPLMISFEADISGGNPPYEIEWIFGDGVTSTRASVKHTFDAGIYTVVLQVTDDDGIMLQKSIPIIASGIPSTDELSGYFTDTGQLEPIDKGMVATFEFTGVADGGEGPYTFVWDFGDGDRAEGGGVVLHQYAEYSEYTVKLTIMDSTGESVQVERKIYISPDENGDDGGLTNANDAGDGDNNFDIYATGAGVIGLLLIFGLFGRKRNQGFLDEERRKIHGEGSIWDEP